MQLFGGPTRSAFRRRAGSRELADDVVHPGRVQLGVRVAGDLGKELPDNGLSAPQQAEAVPEPDRRPLNERVGRLTGRGVMSAVP